MSESNLPQGLVTQVEAKRLARALHVILHGLDDASEDAQTGIVTIEWDADTWGDINKVLDSIGQQEMCHERLHEILELPT